MSDDLNSLLSQLRLLRIQEDDLLLRIEFLSVSTPTPPTFRVGDRVRITNKVSKPTGWQIWDKDTIRLSKIAVVTSVRGERVYVRTDSGFDTWRAPSNLSAEK